MYSQSRTAAAVLEPKDVADTRRQQSHGPFKGLCVICDDRFICTFQRPESGVWHCQEYR